MMETQNQPQEPHLSRSYRQVTGIATWFRKSALPFFWYDYGVRFGSVGELFPAWLTGVFFLAFIQALPANVDKNAPSADSPRIERRFHSGSAEIYALAFPVAAALQAARARRQLRRGVRFHSWYIGTFLFDRWIPEKCRSLQRVVFEPAIFVLLGCVSAALRLPLCWWCFAVAASCVLTARHFRLAEELHEQDMFDAMWEATQATRWSRPPQDLE